MTLRGLDELDRRILYELQREARGASSRDIAKRMSSPPSPSTVRKRIRRLEDEGIVRGYRAEVDYERAGYQLHVHIVCTAPIADRAALSDDALSVPGVVGVRELATGERNVIVTVVGTDGDDLTRIAVELSAVGLTVVDEELVRNDRTRPFAGFAPASTRFACQRKPKAESASAGTDVEASARLVRTMQEDEFLSAVQRRTQVESTDEAYTMARATLDVLGQRITEGEAADIASQLPAALDTALTSDGDAEEFSAAEFVERVRTRELDAGEFADPDTESHIRAVMTVLGNAVSGSELDDARDQLPSEFESLFAPIDMSEQQL